MNVVTSILALLLVLLLDNTVNADCLVEGDMVFIEGQSLGHTGLTCINSTSYNATDSVCGPGDGFDGIIIDIPAVYTCPQQDDEVFSQATTPYCVQCGPPGIKGSAVCLSTPEVPDYCGVNGGNSSGGSSGVTPTPTTTTTAATATPTTAGDEGLLPETTPSPTTTGDEGLLPETTPSPSLAAVVVVAEDGSTMTMSPTVVCNADEEGCVDENYRITYCILAMEGPCPCPEGFTRCPEYTDGSATFGGYCQPVCCDEGPNGTEVGCGNKYGGALYWNTTFCEPVDKGCPTDTTNVGGILPPAEIPGSCNSQEECSATIRSQKPARSSIGVDMCECYATSSTAPFDECEGSQPCATAKCAGNACENYEAYCDFGAIEASGLGELGECLLRPMEETSTTTTTTTEETSPVPTVVSTPTVGGIGADMLASYSIAPTSVVIPQVSSGGMIMTPTISAVAFLLMTIVAMILSN